MAAKDFNDSLNTSGSIVISDDSETTDTEYEPDSKKRRLEEAEAVASKLDGLQKSTASSPSNDVEDQDHSNSDTPASPLATVPKGEGLACLIVTAGHPVEVREQQTQLRARRFGMRRPRRASDTNSQCPSQIEPSRPSAESEVEKEFSADSAASSPSDNDDKDGLDGQSNSSIIPILQSPVPDEYFTDPMDPNEIPSDLEFSPPRPSRPPTPRPSLRHRTRRNAIFERRSPPPISFQQMEDDQFYHDELEVASVSDINENPIEDANSTSGTENEDSVSGVRDETLAATSGHSDNNFADFETVESDKEINSDETHNSSIRSKGLNSSDSEISENDKWTCYVCHAKTMPYLRHCLRCFKIRRNWLPKRPPSRRLKRRKRAEQRSNPINASKTIITSDSEDVVDGPIRRHVGNGQSQQSSSNPPASHLVRPCSSSHIRPVLPAAPSVNLDEGFLIDDHNPALIRLNSHSQPGNVTLLEMYTPPQSQASQQDVTSATQNSEEGTTEIDSSSVPISSQSTSSSQSQTQSTSSSQSQPPIFSSQSSEFLSPPLPKALKHSATAAGQSVCNICYARVKDAAFVHNKVAHQYCCYTCADKILKRDGKCPICRERVLRVVKVIVV